MLYPNQFLHVRPGAVDSTVEFILKERELNGIRQASWTSVDQFGPDANHSAMVFRLVIQHLQQSLIDSRNGQEKVIFRVPFLGPDTVVRLGKAWLVPTPGGLSFMLPDAIAKQALGPDEKTHTVSWEIPLSFARLVKIPDEFLVFYTAYEPRP